MGVRKKKPEIDPRAAKLKAVREQMKELEKSANNLRADLLKDYGPGRYEGFIVLEKTRSNLDKDLLEQKLGNLDPYKKDSTAIYIEFV